MWGIRRWPVNSPHKWSVTRKMFPYDDFNMLYLNSMAPCEISTRFYILSNFQGDFNYFMAWCPQTTSNYQNIWWPNFKSPHESLCHNAITNWGQDKVPAILQTTFSIAFHFDEYILMSLDISLKFVPRGPIDNTLWLVQATSHYLNQWWLVYWRLYASRGLTGLNETVYCVCQALIMLN